MKWSYRAVVLGFVFSVAVQDAVVAASPTQPKPLWHTHYDRARELARREDKPLFVVFR
jgi:hypothetical protein